MVSPKQTHKQTIVTEREGKKRNETKQTQDIYGPGQM